MIRYKNGMIGLLAATVAVAWFWGGAAWAKAPAAPETILAEKCGSCHDRDAAGHYARISVVRKTPEGWEGSIRRMRQWHGLILGEAEERVLVKYLADTQGLAPEEAAPHRAVIERRPGTVEAIDDAELGVYCGRCHTYARAALQRRDTDDWVKHIHTHLGQWPTLEYHASARDREWWKIATTEVAAKLGAKWPLVTEAWTRWQSHRAADLSGRWRLAGHRPGRGDYQGHLDIKRTGIDAYAVSYTLTYADGATIVGAGRSVVYTGYEWRGSAALGNETLHEVYRIAEDGNSLDGRWFLDHDSAIGGDIKAVRETVPAVLAVQPAALKTGRAETVTIIGAKLDGALDLGPGVVVEKTLAHAADHITVVARASKDAVIGPHAVAVGGLSAAGALVVYDKVGSVRVEPALNIARVGANGGPLPVAPSQFEAVGYLDGPDGKAGTADDIRIGVLPARWSTRDFDKEAEEAEDAHFGGRIGRTGLFIPAGAGPNPARKGTNNAANLAVVAQVTDGERTLEGLGHLIVTLQRWNDAPIR